MAEPADVAALVRALGDAGYLTGDALATALFLAVRMRQPILLEGEPGVGKTEAAKALGMAPSQTLRHVLLPQALRLALPPMTNDFVSLLKDSSLVSVITVIELTKRMTIAAVDLHGWLVPGLACAVLYLGLSYPLSELARRLERRLARDRDPRPL